MKNKMLLNASVKPFTAEKPLLTYKKNCTSDEPTNDKGLFLSFNQSKRSIQNITTNETIAPAWLDVLLNNFLS